MDRRDRTLVGVAAWAKRLQWARTDLQSSSRVGWTSTPTSITQSGVALAVRSTENSGSVMRVMKEMREGEK